MLFLAPKQRIVGRASRKLQWCHPRGRSTPAECCFGRPITSLGWRHLSPVRVKRRIGRQRHIGRR
eukprot:5143233-Prymnesium_polylepis.1